MLFSVSWCLGKSSKAGEITGSFLETVKGKNMELFVVFLTFSPDNAVKIRLFHLNYQAMLLDVSVIFNVVVFHGNLWEFMGGNGKKWK